MNFPGHENKHSHYTVCAHMFQIVKERTIEWFRSEETLRIT